MSKRDKYKKLDWAKFADFSSRNSREDLEKLCRGKSADQLVDVFTTRDDAGLYPIHWAAIHNRSDLIEYMVDKGSPLRSRCRNKLFANGSALHLAAINGSIEAASMLLFKCGANQTEPKGSHGGSEASSQRTDAILSWLKQRDSDGQTPLLKSAPPRSKRLDTVRDLLRKNLWSLSGRPAEMALFLICKGADWRETDTVNNMNLMHWAIANDYDDIVNLLLVLDRDVINVPARPTDRPTSQRLPTLNTMTTVDLNSATSSPSDSDNDSRFGSSSKRKPLISADERSKKLIADGLLPLQLAILYGRLGIISLLWHAKTNEKLASPTELDKDSPESQRDLSRRRADSRAELKRIVSRAFWSNRDEVASFARRSALKLLLATDLTLLALIWTPTYATTDDEGHVLLSLRGGLFIFSFCASMALALRVVLKNPGYLRRSSLQYLRELRALMQRRPAPKMDTPLIKLDAQNPEATATKTTSEVRSAEAAKAGEAVSVAARWEHKTELEERVRLLCHKCRCVRRPRSRHCNYCNHCVQDFDHHCIYLGCCVARYNRLDFLVSMVLVAVTGAYGTVLHASSLRSADWSEFWHLLGLIWILKYVLIGGFGAFQILRRACLGVTMYEEIRSARIKRIFGPQGPPERISRSHKSYSTLRDSFWRFAPDRFLTGDLPARSLAHNLAEFANYTSAGEYLLALACPDTTLARSLASSDSRLNLYKFL